MVSSSSSIWCLKPSTGKTLRRRSFRLHGRQPPGTPVISFDLGDDISQVIVFYFPDGKALPGSGHPDLMAKVELFVHVINVKRIERRAWAIHN
jgi:hypothetical protein